MRKDFSFTLTYVHLRVQYIIHFVTADQSNFQVSVCNLIHNICKNKNTPKNQKGPIQSLLLRQALFWVIINCYIVITSYRCDSTDASAPGV